MTEPLRGRLAFVPTRYGDEVVGGSESVQRELAHGLAARGWDVDVLTTCALSHYTWTNEYPPGSFTDGKVNVTRFPTVHDGDRGVRNQIERRIQLGLPITRDEERTWLNGTFRVPALFHHLVEHEQRYRAIVLSPYLFWTTVSCSVVAPEKTVVMPCLHDENYAYLGMVGDVLSDVGQVWFLSEPEHELGHRLAPLGPHHVTGASVPLPEGYDPDTFLSRHGRHRPFVLYAGRREAGKGWDDLLGAFTEAVVEFGADLDLVTTGVGPIECEPTVASHILDLGFVRQDDMPDVFAAAAAYVQPSANESFSRTIMESWLAGTPVIANTASAVVAWHCERSGAGVVYSDQEELVEALLLLAERPDVYRHLAAAGREYVLSNYAPGIVLDRVEAALEELP